MQKKCRFENKLVKPENWTGQEFTFSPTVHGLKNKAEKVRKSGQFLPILATFYQFKSRFEKS
jgi:hypothetical protein